MLAPSIAFTRMMRLVLVSRGLSPKVSYDWTFSSSGAFAAAPSDGGERLCCSGLGRHIFFPTSCRHKGQLHGDPHADECTQLFQHVSQKMWPQRNNLIFLPSAPRRGIPCSSTTPLRTVPIEETLSVSFARPSPQVFPSSETASSSFGEMPSKDETSPSP